MAPRRRATQAEARAQPFQGLINPQAVRDHHERLAEVAPRGFEVLAVHLDVAIVRQIGDSKPINVGARELEARL